MTYSATLTDPHEHDAIPMWESTNHPTATDAYQAAQAHIHATRPGDRIIDRGHGAYDIWADDTTAPTHVATLLIEWTDDPSSGPTARPVIP